MSGQPILEVREMLGHAPVTMTERYAHLASDRLKAAVERWSPSHILATLIFL
jgi:site-specific recombinase XerD